MEYWIAHPCRHWSAELNKRFRLYRIEGGSDHAGNLPGSVWDAERASWVEQRHGINACTLKRQASRAEIQATERML